MSITYPISLPYPAPAHIRLTAQNIAAVSASNFTGAQQVQQWPGEWWEAEVTIPKVSAVDAQLWTAFLASLRGQAGSFLMGPGPDQPAGLGSSMVNRLLGPEDWTNAAWSLYGTTGTTLSAGSVPDPFGGTSTAGTVIAFPAVAAGGVTGIQQSVQADLRNGVYTYSVYLKASSAQTVGLYLIGDLGLPTQQAYGLSCNVTTAWQRFSVSGSFSSCRSRQITVDIHSIGGSGGMAAQTVQAWGAQLERASSASVYVDHLTPIVNGAGQAGSTTLTLAGWPSFQVLVPTGGYFQIGSHLYMALTTGQWASGPQTLQVFPALRADVVNLAPIIVNDPVGLFRLSENTRTWDRSPGYPNNVFDFSFKAREVL